MGGQVFDKIQAVIDLLRGAWGTVKGVEGRRGGSLDYACKIGSRFTRLCLFPKAETRLFSFLFVCFEKCEMNWRSI